MAALGILEVKSQVTSIVALDAMLKVADIRLVTTERALGGELVTIVVEGNVTAVQEAVAVGEKEALAIGKVVAKVVIPNPTQTVQNILSLSAKKFEA